MQSNKIKTLILKDNYNSFEQFYIDGFNQIGIDTTFYYISNSKWRKFWTHNGIPFEDIWYGNWKHYIDKYDLIIVFDSIHNSNLLKYLHKHSSARLIFWHWNPLKSKEDFKILKETRYICEHWTFNAIDASKYDLKLNKQFFFFQEYAINTKINRAFFVGTDKGRYEKLVNIAANLSQYGVEIDFHVIDKNKNGKYYEKNFLEYNYVLNKLCNSKFVVEIVQAGQTGLTARSLEALFMRIKLITNNSTIKKYDFYNPQNIFIINEDTDIAQFLASDYIDIDSSLLFAYSAQGWLKKIEEN